MTKIVPLLLLLLLPLTAHGWIILSSNSRKEYRLSRTSSSAKVAKTETENNNPCWQDIYDEDCSMDNAYAASFVASEWLKRMPCGEGIEDCDMPDQLKTPGNRQEEGIDDVDVMEFLNLNRASSVGKKSEGGVSP